MTHYRIRIGKVWGVRACSPRLQPPRYSAGLTVATEAVAHSMSNPSS